jgi:hypothetical protein
MAKSKVVLNYKLEHTNKELDGRLTCRKGSTRVLIKGVGRPACTDRPGAILLCCFVTVCSMGLHLPNILVHSFACIIAPST